MAWFAFWTGIAKIILKADQNYEIKITWDGRHFVDRGWRLRVGAGSSSRLIR
jgi:hypothetical protein